METATYLVAGGCGFLGCHIVKHLLERYPHCRVRVLDMRRSDDLPETDRVEFVEGNILSSEEMEKACAGVHTVFNTVSPVHGRGAELYYKVNVDGGRTVMDAAQKVGVKGYVYTSTASVVFCGKDIRNGDESLPYCEKHIDPYNHSKELAEREVLARNAAGLPTVSLRPSGIFGPGDRQAWPGFIDAARKGSSKFVLGSGKNLMDWTYVGNLADAHILAAERLQEDPASVGGQAFFITNDEPIPFWDMAIYAWKNLGYPTPTITVPKFIIWYLSILIDLVVLLLSPFVELHPTITFFRIANATCDRYFCIDKAKKRLGYKPRVSLAEAMEITLEHFKDQRNPNAPK